MVHWFIQWSTGVKIMCCQNLNCVERRTAHSFRVMGGPTIYLSDWLKERHIFEGKNLILGFPFKTPLHCWSFSPVNHCEVSTLAGSMCASFEGVASTHTEGVFLGLATVDVLENSFHSVCAYLTCWHHSFKSSKPVVWGERECNWMNQTTRHEGNIDNPPVAISGLSECSHFSTYHW